MTNFDKLTKKELIELLTKQAQEVVQAQAQAEKAQAEKAQAEKQAQELTGFDSARLAYEEKKFNDSIACNYVFPEYFTQDTVTYRAMHNAYLIELGRRYIQEVIQAQAGTQAGAGKKAGRKAGAGRKASAGTQASAGKAQDKTQNDCYRYLCNTCKYELLELDRYLTIKKENKTVARVYVMKDNKLKFLIKEDVAKKAGLDFTTMKFNLPCAVVVSKAQEVDAVLNAF